MKRLKGALGVGNRMEHGAKPPFFLLQSGHRAVGLEIRRVYHDCRFLGAVEG